MADSVMREISCELQGLHFNRGDIPVLRGLDLTFEPGKLHGIIGPNGSGKSTLLDVITGQHGPSKGDILLNGTSLTAMAPSELARNVAVLPQQTDFNFPFTVRETVLMGRHPHIPRFTRPSLHDFEIVDEALRQTDMT